MGVDYRSTGGVCISIGEYGGCLLHDEHFIECEGRESCGLCETFDVIIFNKEKAMSKDKCKTCGGSGEVPCFDKPTPKGQPFAFVRKPCPDCSPADSVAEFVEEAKLMRDYNALPNDVLETLSKALEIIEELLPYKIAVEKRHNGYDLDNELCPKPKTPEHALQNLQDEWDSMEDDYAKEIVRLQTKAKEQEAIIKLAKDMYPKKMQLVINAIEVTKAIMKGVVK